MNRRRLPDEERAPGFAGRAKRALIALARVVAAFSLAAAVVFGMREGWKRLRTGPQYDVAHVVFSGNHRAAAADLLDLVGPLKGRNIFSIDLAAAAQGMERHPWVEHVRVARDLPDTLRVAVDERQAVALLSEDGLRAVDRDGTTFKTVTASDHLDLPVISGDEKELVTNPDGSANSAIVTALHLIGAYGVRKIAVREPLSEVRITEEAGVPAFNLYCGDSAVEVKLGVVRTNTDLSTLFDRLDRVWQEFDRRSVRPRSIDLGNRQRPDWIPVRLESPVAQLGPVALKK